MQIRQRSINHRQACPWLRRDERPSPKPEPIRVVIADDEAFARAAITLLLKNETDFQIVGTADTGNRAVEAVETLQPDLLLLDIDMPGLDGFEVLRRVRWLSRMEVIFITAHENLAGRAFEVNALDYLLKPYSRARFRTAISRAREHFHPTPALPCTPRVPRG